MLRVALRPHILRGPAPLPEAELARDAQAAAADLERLLRGEGEGVPDDLGNNGRGGFGGGGGTDDDQGGAGGGYSGGAGCDENGNSGGGGSYVWVALAQGRSH